jgi:competence ComEA-like helix-hairpin-helix protein
MKGLMGFILLIFLISSISSSCNETQIDINTANLTELDKIKWVGISTAESIINYRENNLFDSIDELINVSGIGEAKLADIKMQGLACVGKEKTETPETEQETEKEEENRAEGTNSVTLETIELNSKDIKSRDNKEALKRNLALGGITAFCIILGVWFFLKTARRKNRNEFR